MKYAIITDEANSTKGYIETENINDMLDDLKDWAKIMPFGAKIVIEKLED